MMISYMVDGEGFLIVNRSIVAQDIQEFEYSPKPEFATQITIFNVEDERATLQKFFDVIKDIKPFIITTYNGDRFDWPFIMKRALVYGISMEEEIGVAPTNKQENVFWGRWIAHLDCYSWVDRDSYLPMGSRGLKAVTKNKLRYDPVELEPELMVPMARNNP